MRAARDAGRARRLWLEKAAAPRAAPCAGRRYRRGRFIGTRRLIGGVCFGGGACLTGGDLDGGAPPDNSPSGRRRAAWCGGTPPSPRRAMSSACASSCTCRLRSSRSTASPRFFCARSPRAPSPRRARARRSSASPYSCFDRRRLFLAAASATPRCRRPPPPPPAPPPPPRSASRARRPPFTERGGGGGARAGRRRPCEYELPHRRVVVGVPPPESGVVEEGAPHGGVVVRGMSST